MPYHKRPKMWERNNGNRPKNLCDKIAEDTILPMKLYTSSLLGGGTNVKVAFAQDMKSATNDFEKAQKKLAKAIAKRDRESSSTSLGGLGVGTATLSRIRTFDWSRWYECEICRVVIYAYTVSFYTHTMLLIMYVIYIGGGDIPSVDEIRRSACRVQGRTFEQKIKDRDSRLQQDTPSTVASSQ